MTFELENLFIFGKVSDFYYTSRLSTQNGQICLQKYPPISVKISITNYLKQNAIDYQCHLTIRLRSEKRSYFEKKHNSPRPKKRMGTNIGGGKGAIPPKFLAFLVILCFERRCRKQNTQMICLPQICGLATSLGTRRDKHPEKTGLPGSHKQKRPDQPVKRATAPKNDKNLSFCVHKQCLENCLYPEI